MSANANGHNMDEAREAGRVPSRKPAKNQSTKPVVTAIGRKVTPSTGLPASQRVTCPPCSSCRSDETFIYATRQIARYVKCRHCGHTFSIGPPVSPVDDIETR